MDFLNALITLAMVFGASANIFQILKDRNVKGVHWVQPTISTTACAYSIFFYFNLEQWWSFAAYIVLTLAMMTWLYLIFEYKKLEKIDVPSLH